MKHQAAYSLLWLSGKSAPTKEETESMMKESGVKVDKESLDVFFKLMDGKDVPTLIKEGEKKMASMPSGGSDGGVPSDSAGGTTTAPEKKEEKKDEEEVVDMTGLFGGDDDDY